MKKKIIFLSAIILFLSIILFFIWSAHSNKTEMVMSSSYEETKFMAEGENSISVWIEYFGIHNEDTEYVEWGHCGKNEINSINWEDRIGSSRKYNGKNYSYKGYDYQEELNTIFLEYVMEPEYVDVYIRYYSKDYTVCHEEKFGTYNEDDIDYNSIDWIGGLEQIIEYDGKYYKYNGNMDYYSEDGKIYLEYVKETEYVQVWLRLYDYKGNFITVEPWNSQELSDDNLYEIPEQVYDENDIGYYPHYDLECSNENGNVYFNYYAGEGDFKVRAHYMYTYYGNDPETYQMIDGYYKDKENVRLKVFRRLCIT